MGRLGADDASARVGDHAAETTDVHGIADTADLETQAGAQAKVDAHAAEDAADAVHGLAQAAAIANASTAHSVGGLNTVTVNGLESALNALGARINECRDALRNAGLEGGP